MLIHCAKCGRPACGITLPEFSKGEAFTLKKLIGGMFGDGAGDVIGIILDPTPEGVRDHFTVQCAACAGGQADGNR